MGEKLVLVEHVSTINTIIRSTFQTTQRIKFTAFDVSNKYLIFGVNSGGIYIFSRESCQFLKLIPSTHGPTNLLSISDNEDNLAIAVSSGLIIILENCFIDLNFQQQVFTEHEGSIVTALKWNGNDLYCGDTAGKVSVISLKNFLSKAIFQTPSACLMHLDSEIVQLDTHSKFLLVSTMTRSLLCDTETERYRQIGKKNRDGKYGACFINVVQTAEFTRSAPYTRGIFQIIADNEQFYCPQMDENIKIYCARPGARLWQANFQANVIFTHQFRSSLNQIQSNLINLNENLDAELNIKNFTEEVKAGDNFNFGRIFRFLNKFILTFKEDAFYIFDPISSLLLFWSGHIKRINDIKIINSFLYIWHKHHDITIISLLTIEELIINSLIKKQYRLCGQICVEFLDDVLALIDTSKRIHLVSALESKLEYNEILEKLSPIMNRLKESATTPILGEYKNGIVNIKNCYTTEAVNLPESVANFQSNTQKTSKKPEKNPIDIMHEQYKISKIHKNIETTKFMKLMDSSSPEQKCKLFQRISLELSESDEDVNLWAKDNYLKYLNNCLDASEIVINFALEAFLKLNESKMMACKCSFPLPKAHKTLPKYYELGCQLMEKSSNFQLLLLNSVPYMQKYILHKINNLHDAQSNLALIIQFSDEKMVSLLANKITYDIWDEAIKYFLQLKNGICLNCSQKIDIEGLFSWTTFSLLIIDSIKASNALKLLKHYAHLVPNGELDDLFYQYCIFSTVANLSKGAPTLSKIVPHENVQQQFSKSIGKYLQNKYLNGIDYVGICNTKSAPNSNCDYCQLPLQMPIIDDSKVLKCGHIFHCVCFLYNENKCPHCIDNIL